MRQHLKELEETRSGIIDGSIDLVNPVVVAKVLYYVVKAGVVIYELV